MEGKAKGKHQVKQDFSAPFSLGSFAISSFHRAPFKLIYSDDSLTEKAMCRTLLKAGKPRGIVIQSIESYIVSEFPLAFE